MSNEIEIDIKTGRIVEMLEREDLGGVILNGQHNFAWITGGASNAIDKSRENGAASILIGRDGRRFLLANNIEMPRMLAEEVPGDIFEPIEFAWQDEKTSGNFLAEKAAEVCLGEIATDIPISAAARAVDGSIARCRYELTSEEKDRIRALGSDAGRILGNPAESIRSGMTEIEIANQIQRELALSGIESVVTLVAADDRISAFRHPVPTNKSWERALLLVSCAKRSGLIVSLSRIIHAGPPSQELVDKTEAAAFVFSTLLHRTRQGVKGRELYAAAKQAYERRGFAGEIDKHHQGGAAGYRTREWVAHPASGEVVVNDQAFAWNPSITGTKVEETVIVGENGIEPITESVNFPVITTTIDGVAYRSPGILEI